MSHKMKEDIEQQSVIYHSPELTDFQKRVNNAATKIALKNPSLVHKKKRGMLLEKARKQVSNEGYVFKKGKSCSKLYGQQHSQSKSPTKRVKISEALHTQRSSELREDIEGIDHHVQIKERRLRQSESSQNYIMCDRFYDEIRELKRARRRELMQLEAKEKRANRYRNYWSSNVSRSATPSAEQSCSITPTPTPLPVAAASPVNVSPVFLQTYRDWMH